MAALALLLALVVGLLRMELVDGTRDGAVPATQAGAARDVTLCEEMQRLTDNKLTDAEFVGTWLARASAEPRVHSPLNRPAVAQRVHWHPDGAPRTNTPRDVVEARLKLQQIHGIDEKRQYFEADGSLTLRWKDDHWVSVRACFATLKEEGGRKDEVAKKTAETPFRKGRLTFASLVWHIGGVDLHAPPSREQLRTLREGDGVACARRDQ